MSDFSVFLHKAAAFLNGAVAAAPASQPLVADAALKLSAAGSAMETAAPVLAKAGADAALAALGPFGLAATPFANSFIDALIAELSARKAQPALSASAAAGQLGTAINRPQ